MESWAKRAMQASNTRSVHYSISSIKPRQPPCIDPLFLCKSLNISYNTCEIPPSLTPTSFSGWIAFELTTPETAGQQWTVEFFDAGRYQAILQ